MDDSEGEGEVAVAAAENVATTTTTPPPLLFAAATRLANVAEITPKPRDSGIILIRPQ